MEDTTTNYSTIIISVLMAVVIIATVMIPIITATTQTTTTTEIENEGAGWLKLGYNSGNDFDFEITNDNSNIIIGDQTGTMGDNIFYADSKNVIFADSDKNAIFLLNTDTSSVHKFSSTVSVENTEGTLNISDGTETVVSSESPTWAYIPDSAGEYGFFTDGGLNLKEGKPTVAVGSYAGVFAYNDTVVAPNDLGSLGFIMSGDYAEGEVNWIIPSEIDTLSAIPTDTVDPAVLDLDPVSIQPIDLGGSGSVGLMAVPTPTYTDGVWGFDNTQYGTFIVSYSGPGGDIVIPSTVSDGTNTYTVAGLGKVGSGNNMIDNSSISPGSTITIPDTVHVIRGYVFDGCSNLTGDLIIPEGVNSAGDHAYYQCRFNHLVLPSTMRFIEHNSFTGNPFKGTLVIPESIYRVGNYAFANTLFDSMIVLGTFDTSASSMTSISFAGTQIKEVLNLGDSPITTTYYGLNADSVQDHVTALGYIAPVSIHETVIVEDTSLSATLLKLFPVFMVLAVVIFIGYAMYRPDSEFVRSLKSRF